MSKRAMVTLMLGSWLVLAARPTSADEKRDDAERELKKLEGTWVMVSGERDGKVLAADVVKKARLVIENDKDSVLVMKVAVAKGETVELASG